ncbi:MAG TPA: molybdopterin cofactor-binding domain-containing protein [Xanthobacteraceae bacterium]|nr:molybdopterin cofactor-binding domain-containing protein [Xanthobacteraceae bacterium]
MRVEGTVLSRRDVMQGLAAGAVVLVGGRLVANEAAAQASAAAPLNAWIAVATDGRVTLQCAHSEMGQGIYTTFAAIMADELEADWAKCDIVFSPVAPAYRHPVYNWQFTGNAESIRSYHGLIRKMAAAAREMLIAAAADQLKVPVSELAARGGKVLHHASGRALDFGALAQAAAARTPPAQPNVKPETEWRLVGHGRSLPRRDVPDKVHGTAVFGIDVKVPGMVYAAVMSTPVLGGKAASFDEALVAGMPGVIKVVPLGSAVAVVAEHYWQARLALAKLKIEWQGGESFDDAALEKSYRAAQQSKDGWALAENKGDAVTTLAGAKHVITAEYRAPWVAHAPMEPMNATVAVTEAGVTIWAPTQGMEMTQIVVAKVLGVAPDKINIHRTYLGGGFGRRLLADFVAQAALCAKAAGRPVKLIWSREEDIKQDVFRPGFLNEVRASLAADGMPEAIHFRLVAPTILAPVSPTPVRPGMVDALCCEGLMENPYGIAHRRVDYNMLATPVPTMVLRTTGHGPNNFTVESFVDELAHAAKRDPYEYRRRLLAENPVALKALDRAAELAAWGKAAPGRFQGMAFADCFGSYLVQVAELSIENGAVKLHKITSVCDPGRVLDRVNATSMIEGGVVWGLSAALYSALSFDKGHVRETNFDRFRVVTLPDTPELVTDFLENRQVIGGLGEVGPVAVPAAIANALFAATGVRHRRYPFAADGVLTTYGKIFG